MTIPEPAIAGVGNPVDPERYAAAVAYAADAHGSQPRKGTTVPYLSHLLSVSALVMEDGGSEDEAIAGLLHDTVEDQGGAKPLDDIRQRFGERIAALVEACTDYDVDGERDPWPQRKRRYLEHIGEMPADVRRISLADKLHNARAILRDYRQHGEALWGRFNAGRHDQLWYYRELAEAFARHSGSPLAAELGAVVAELERLATLAVERAEGDPGS
jgi:(p)ppGpp synthase/HD superfamily hydrolase